MAASPLVPKNGAISLGTWGSTGIDFNTFDLEAKQAVEVITPYGTNHYAVAVGSGTPELSFNIGGFAIAHATNTPLTIGDNGTTTPNFASGSSGTGVAAVFTLDTGVTESFNATIESLKISHGRMKASVPVTIQGRQTGEVAEVYATS